MTIDEFIEELRMVADMHGPNEMWTCDLDDALEIRIHMGDNTYCPLTWVCAMKGKGILTLGQPRVAAACLGVHEDDAQLIIRGADALGYPDPLRVRARLLDAVGLVEPVVEG